MTSFSMTWTVKLSVSCMLSPAEVCLLPWCNNALLQKGYQENSGPFNLITFSRSFFFSSLYYSQTRLDFIAIFLYFTFCRTSFVVNFNLFNKLLRQLDWFKKKISKPISSFHHQIKSGGLSYLESRLFVVLWIL